MARDNRPRPVGALVLLAVALLGSGCTGSSASRASGSATGSSAGASATGSPPSALAAVSHPIDQMGAPRLVTIQVAGSPDWPLVAFGSLWVTNSGTSLIQRFDPRTNQVTSQLAITNPCNGITTGAGSVWAASCTGNYVVRIDPTTTTITGRRQVTLAPDGEGLLAYGFGSVWAATGDGRLLRLSPSLNRVQATIPIPNGASAVIADSAAVWLTDPLGSHLLRVDPKTDRISRTYATGGHPQFLASGFGSIWTLNQTDGTVTRVDENTGGTRTVVAESPGDGGYITTGLGAVWLTIYTKPLTRIDPVTNAVTEQLTGVGGDGVITGFGSVWLLNNKIPSMFRIAPK